MWSGGRVSQCLGQIRYAIIWRCRSRAVCALAQFEQDLHCRINRACRLGLRIAWIRVDSEQTAWVHRLSSAFAVRINRKFSFLLHIICHWVIIYNGCTYIVSTIRVIACVIAMWSWCRGQEELTFDDQYCLTIVNNVTIISQNYRLSILLDYVPQIRFNLLLCLLGGHVRICQSHVYFGVTRTHLSLYWAVIRPAGFLSDR